MNKIMITEFIIIFEIDSVNYTGATPQRAPATGAPESIFGERHRRRVSEGPYAGSIVLLNCL